MTDERLTEQEKAANRRRWWGLTDGAEIQQEAESADTRIQATPCPDPDHGHGCYARASEEGEHRRRNGCPPACNCPPGTHRPATHEEWFVRNPVTLLAETRLDPTPPVDRPCAGCPSTILATTRYWAAPDGDYHLGCWASRSYHKDRGLPYPPVRGLQDGKALESAARQEDE